MRHRVQKKHLGRDAGQRKALFRGLAKSLVEHGSIRTTLAKAKALRPIVEKLVTIARQGDLTARRRLIAFLQDKDLVQKMLDEVGPVMRTRPGGYTRIVKLGPRSGDQTEMARIEWVEAPEALEGTKGIKGSEEASRSRRRPAEGP
ncbi:50S ribosomal protein L17, partial [Candidatus Parcubacteria bacterium]|nr:50S ribosomal protein L17 [Candidatus Parcubacteria bacterium]